MMETIFLHKEYGLKTDVNEGKTVSIWKEEKNNNDDVSSGQ